MKQNPTYIWRIMIIVLLSAVAMATAIFAMIGPACCPFIILKALTTSLLVLVALVAATGKKEPYGWYIVAGLLFSLNGDVLLSLGEKYFLAGLVSFLCAHISYLFAFTSHSPFAAKKIPFISWSVYGGIMIIILWSSVPAVMKIPVILYILVILTMAAQSSSRYLTNRSAATFMACFGATLFVLSDSLLAFSHFHTQINYLSIISLSTYYAAQWCIAISVPLHQMKNKINPNNA